MITTTNTHHSKELYFSFIFYFIKVHYFKSMPQTLDQYWSTTCSAWKLINQNKDRLFDVEIENIFSWTKLCKTSAQKLKRMNLLPDESRLQFLVPRTFRWAKLMVSMFQESEMKLKCLLLRCPAWRGTAWLEWEPYRTCPMSTSLSVSRIWRWLWNPLPLKLGWKYMFSRKTYCAKKFTGTPIGSRLSAVGGNTSPNKKARPL